MSETDKQCNVLSAEEAAEYIGISLWTLRQRTRPGCTDPIPHVRLGKRVLFYRDVLDEWRKSKSKESLQPVQSKSMNYGRVRPVTQ